jgi:hypothetical protein
MKGKGGRFGKYGEVKRKTKLRQARLSHLERPQPGLSSEQSKGGKRRKPRQER